MYSPIYSAKSFEDANQWTGSSGHCSLCSTWAKMEIACFMPGVCQRRDSATGAASRCGLGTSGLGPSARAGRAESSGRVPSASSPPADGAGTAMAL